jgi:polyhydroxybutyrate depolymerase
LPEPWEVPGHHLGPIPAEEQIRCAADTGGLAVGELLPVAGHDDRPTFLQPATDPTAPLVVVFHGQNGCIENVQSRSDLDVIAAPAGVAVLWLSGQPLPTRSWNTNGSCCEPASTNGVQDMPYVEAAIQSALSTGLSPRRTLSAGVSNGGGMAISVACRRPDLFDAAVSVAGWAPIACDGLPLSLLVFGGSADESLGSARASQVASMWVSDVVSCPGAPVEESEGIRSTSTWTGCSEGTTVRLARLQGVPHVWPKFADYDMDDDIVLFALGRFDASTP